MALYWPGMTNDIEMFVGACPACQEISPSKPKGEVDIDEPAAYAWQEIAADFCLGADGRNWLVVVDRFSGWIEAIPKRSDYDAADTVAAFQTLLSQYGIPRKLKTDGGLQFASETFTTYLKKKGIIHAMSAPYTHCVQAEAAVKTFKRLLEATHATNGSLEDGMLELRCTPGDDGRSPAQKFFGRPFRGHLPKIQEDVPQAHGGPVKPTVKQDFVLNQRVRVQNPITGRWSTYGTIVRRSRKNCKIKMDSGRFLWRHQRQLRPFLEREEQSVVVQQEEMPTSTTAELRRSTRVRKKPERFSASV